MRVPLWTVPAALASSSQRQPAEAFHQELQRVGVSPSAQARSLGKEATVTKTFKFKDDFFLSISPLPKGISPGADTEQLLAALEEYGEAFRDAWAEALAGELPEECAVSEMSLPVFSICQWRYPDYYDVDELPAAGQSYVNVHQGTYVQRLYYQVESLKISCLDPIGDYPTYQDLNKDAYTSAAFSGSTSTFPHLLKSCSGYHGDGACFYSDISSVTCDAFNDENAQVFVQRFMDVEMYLKCLDRDGGYGVDVANVLIDAMDRYFELNVQQPLTQEILTIVPEGSVYNYASPYGPEVDRLFFTHGPYYTGGQIVAQVRAQDGDWITKFNYGFDVVWFWPKGATDDIIPDVPASVNPVYQNGAFLAFLQQEYSQYDWVAGLQFCEPVDTAPDFPLVSLVPTPVPTERPTELSEMGEKCSSDEQCISGLLCDESTETCVCDIDTDFGCEEGNVCKIYEKDQVPRCYCDMFNDGGNNGCADGQYCRFSCKFTSDNPRCHDDEFVRDCFSYGDGYTCADANNDGAIDANDKSGGCDYRAPTSAPQVFVGTGEPTAYTTPAPTISIGAITPEPTLPAPTYPPTPFPSPTIAEIITCDSNSTNTCPDGMCCVDNQCVKCICNPVEPTNPIVGTCGNGDRGDGICAWEGYCCSQWGWCGTTVEYCEGPSNAPTPSDGGFYPPPTPSLEAGKCGSGDAGEGLCADPEHCCSQWGYCGPGEGYCYTIANADGSCGGGGVGDGICGSGQCCSQYGYCGEGAEYCTGYVDKGEATETEKIIIENAPLPQDLIPVFGFRCGITEVDARDNCKKECTHHVQCEAGEECWGIQLNYCNTFEEGTHPVCTDLDRANTDSRCGYDEVNARQHCGRKCQADTDCGEQQYCYPTILNLCDCFEEMGNGSIDPVFTEAEDSLTPYFLGELVAAEKPVAMEGDGEVEGVPRNGSYDVLGTAASLFVSVLAILAVL